MSKAMTIVAGIALCAGAASAQEQERPTEDFDESVMTDENRRERTGMEAESEHERVARPDLREPYESQAEERPTPLEDRYDPGRQTLPSDTDESYGADVRERDPPTGVAPASTAVLDGKTVVTSRGEEVGTIEQVGYSRQHGERVATVDVGGFLGAGDKLIAIPISELGLGGEDDEVTTSMTRASLRQAPEFDPSELVTAE